MVSGIALGLAGCAPAAPAPLAGDSDDSGLLQVLSGRSPRPPAGGQYIENEPNDRFENADVVVSEDDVELVGGIAAGATDFDQDIYELGAASAGDRILVELDLDSGNDVVLGMLDDQQCLLAYVDPTSSVTGPREIDLVLHESTSLLYAVIATRSGSITPRAYSVRFTVERAAGLQGYQPQLVVLNFDGADAVRIGNRPFVDVPPFDAANISSRFAEQTEMVIAHVLELVREDYAGLGIEIYPSGDPAIPAGEHTTVYFGTYDSRLLGLADNIDPYNVDPSQSAILYTDTFSLFDVLRPSLEEISQALANVASHEAGHLLGLRHTEDIFSLMDITATARQMLSDQWFRNADLHPTVLPIGLQDAPALLAWTVGGSLIPPSSGKVDRLYRQAAAVNDPNDFYIPRGLLGTCSRTSHDSQDAEGH